jgi:hypothetical protein
MDNVKFDTRLLYAYEHIQYEQWHISEFYSRYVSITTCIIFTFSYLQLPLFVFNTVYVNWMY